MANPNQSKWLFTWRDALCSAEGPPSTTRLVLLVLSTYMNADGSNCFPSTQTIAIASGLSEKSVITHLQVAAKLGWIRKCEHGRSFGGRGWKKHRYEPLIPANLITRRTEGCSARQDQGAESESPKLEPKGAEALKDVQSTSSVNTTRNSLSAENLVSNAKENFMKTALGLGLGHKWAK